MKPRSSTLFHFTKSIESLKSILSNGFYPRYCLEDTSWLDWPGNKHAFPMVCFCDIPLSKMFEHVENYGSYGIGLSKEWGCSKLVVPVSYVSMGNGFASDVVQKLSGVWKLVNEHNAKCYRTSNAVQELCVQGTFNLMKYVKPLSGSMVSNGKIRQDVDFQQENEWRYIPTLPSDDMGMMNEIDFNDENTLNMNNQEIAKLPLGFSFGDIKYIFVNDYHEVAVIYAHLLDLMKEAGNSEVLPNISVIAWKNFKNDL